MKSLRLLVCICLFVPLTALALRFGPNKIRKCSNCAELFRERSIMSGNSMDAVWWTDGKLEAPSLPDEPKLVRCRKCQTLLWVADMELVGEEGFPTSKDPWRDVQRPERADEPNLLAYAAATKDPKKERYVRLRAWWSRNDAIRRGQPDTPGWTTERRQNIQRLQSLLDLKEPQDRLLVAEIERELGNFDRALKILAEDFPEDYRYTANKVRTLAREKKSDVASLQ